MTITYEQLKQAEQEHFNHIKSIVNQWARNTVPREYMHSSPQTYWGMAVSAGIITREDYECARIRYGNMWNYVGD